MRHGNRRPGRRGRERPARGRLRGRTTGQRGGGDERRYRGRPAAAGAVHRRDDGDRRIVAAQPHLRRRHPRGHESRWQPDLVDRAVPATVVVGEPCHPSRSLPLGPALLRPAGAAFRLGGAAADRGGARRAAQRRPRPLHAILRTGGADRRDAHHGGGRQRLPDLGQRAAARPGARGARRRRELARAGARPPQADPVDRTRRPRAGVLRRHPRIADHGDRGASLRRGRRQQHQPQLHARAAGRGGGVVALPRRRRPRRRLLQPQLCPAHGSRRPVVAAHRPARSQHARGKPGRAVAVPRGGRHHARPVALDGHRRRLQPLHIDVGGTDAPLLVR
jgi:hypothetical protein